MADDDGVYQGKSLSDLPEEILRVIDGLAVALLTGSLVAAEAQLKTGQMVTLLGVIPPADLVEDLEIEIPEDEAAVRPLAIIITPEVGELFVQKNLSSPEKVAKAQEKWDVREALKANAEAEAWATADTAESV